MLKWCEIFTRGAMSVEPPSPYPASDWKTGIYSVWLHKGLTYILLCNVTAMDELVAGAKFTVSINRAKLVFGHDKIRMHFDQELFFKLTDIVRECTYPYVSVNLNDPYSGNNPILFLGDY